MALTGFGSVAFDTDDLLAARVHRVGERWQVVCVIDVGTAHEGISRVDVTGPGAITLWKIIDPSFNPESNCERFADWVLRMPRVKFIQFAARDRARVFFVTTRVGSVASVDLEGPAAEKLYAHFPEPVSEELQEG